MLWCSYSITKIIVAIVGEKLPCFSHKTMLISLITNMVHTNYSVNFCMEDITRACNLDALWKPTKPKFSALPNTKVQPYILQKNDQQGLLLYLPLKSAFEAWFWPLSCFLIFLLVRSLQDVFQLSTSFRRTSDNDIPPSRQRDQICQFCSFGKLLRVVSAYFLAKRG